MNINKKRVWYALGIGFFVSLPILYVYLVGEVPEDTIMDTLAGVLMTPAMLLAMPLLFLAPFFENPDWYVLGVFFYIIPFLSVTMYALLGYAGLALTAKKK